MSTRGRRILAAPLLGIGITLAAAALAVTTVAEGYYMRAKVTRVGYDGSIDVWVTSLHRLPRESPAATDTDLPQLPRVIATLELRDAAVAAGLRSADLQGARISLRGKCEDLGRAVRVPVIQVRLGARERWLQANLEPENRAGSAAFRRLAAGVCPGVETDETDENGETAAEQPPGPPG